MTNRTLSAGPFFRSLCFLLTIVMATALSASALAQTYGAQQAVRRSVDNLGGSPSDTDQGTGAVYPTGVSYQRDVLPILRANCHGCHRPPRVSGGLDMTAFGNLLGGGESGIPAVVPGSPDESNLVQQITPVDGTAAMPPAMARKPPLDDSQIALIRRWIEEGARDDSQPSAMREAYDSERGIPYESTAGMIDTTYVAPTAIAVVAIRPAQIMSSPMAELLPLEVLTAAGQQYLGVDPAGVEEIVAFVGQINLMGPTDYGVTVKFSSPFRGASIKREVRAHAQLSEFAGKRYLQSQHPILPSFFGPDNRTLVVAPDATLRRLVESKAQPKIGPIIDRISAVPSGSDLYLAVESATLRPFMDMGIAQWKSSGKVPPPAVKFLELPKLISAAELTFNLSASGPMSLVLHANDEEAAQQIETLFSATDAANYQVAAPADRYTSVGSYEGEDPVAQAVTQFTERFSRPFVPQRSGTAVTLFHVEAQSQAQQQLASLAVFGVGIGIQAAQAARAASQIAAPTSLRTETGEIIEPTSSDESPPAAEYPRR